MKFDLRGYKAYVISDTEQGCFINDCHGYYMEADQMIELGKKLIATAKKKGVKQELIEINAQNDPYQYWNEIKGEQKPKRIENAQVYLMKCGGKYKIGVSKDVERRKRQLDNRPFPVEIIATSPFIEDAFTLEKELHEVYECNRIDGEWFDFTADKVNSIIEQLRYADEVCD